MSYRQPTSLVKFTDAKSALRILSETTLRWSAPSLFLDPFELDHHTKLNFDSQALLNACVKSTLGMIFSRDDPKGVSPLLKAVRRWRSEDRFDSEEEAQDVLSDLLLSMVQQREPEMLSLMREWLRYASGLRILCLAESHENVGLWQRYADEHAGVAIRFASGEETSMEHPMAMEYTETKPEITALSEQMDILMNQAQIQVQDSFSEKFLRKSKLSIKEREWRIFRSNPASKNADDEMTWFDNVPFRPSEVRSIYFGAKLDPKDKVELNTIIKKKFPKAKLFQAVPSINHFELEFERLNPAHTDKPVAGGLIGSKAGAPANATGPGAVTPAAANPGAANQDAAKPTASDS